MRPLYRSRRRAKMDYHADCALGVFALGLRVERLPSTYQDTQAAPKQIPQTMPLSLSLLFFRRTGDIASMLGQAKIVPLLRA